MPKAKSRYSVEAHALHIDNTFTWHIVDNTIPDDQTQTIAECKERAHASLFCAQLNKLEELKREREGDG